MAWSVELRGAGRSWAKYVPWPVVQMLLRLEPRQVLWEGGYVLRRLGVLSNLFHRPQLGTFGLDRVCQHSNFIDSGT